jgi:FkbM family methyltransferase
MLLRSIIFSLSAIALSGRVPSRRAVAAIAKLCGRQLTRRWPFLPRADEENLNLEFDDFLALQYARSRNFVALVVGAFDGVTNDPISHFIRKHRCGAILVEPQPRAFKRLCENMSDFNNIILVNAAIDEVSGLRDIYCVSLGADELPPWTEQLASFRKEHILSHEDRAPGVSKNLLMCKVPTMSFEDLLEKYGVESLDALQIDAEGMDAQLLAWFPFERIKPALLHYETAHMSADEQRVVRNRLRNLGYIIRQYCPVNLRGIGEKANSGAAFQVTSGVCDLNRK